MSVYSQRLFVEMVQMARRPFSSVQVEMNPINVPEENVATIAVSDALGRRKKVNHMFSSSDDFFQLSRELKN